MFEAWGKLLSELGSAEDVNALKTFTDKMKYELSPILGIRCGVLQSQSSDGNMSVCCYKIIEHKQWMFSRLKGEKSYLFPSEFSRYGTSMANQIGT